MSTHTIAGLSALALALGGALGLWARPPAPEPPPLPTTDKDGTAEDPCTDLAAGLAMDLSGVRQDLAALELTLPMARARARMHGALPSTWPHDTPIAYREPSVRASLEGLPTSSLFGLDCSEYPCLFALIDDAPLAASGTPGPEAGSSYAAVLDLECGMEQWRTQRFIDDTGAAHLITLSSCGALATPDVRARTAHRLREFSSELQP